MRNKEIEKIAAALYSPKMPYHNFGHAFTVMQEGEAIVERCRSENVPIDEEVVYYSLLFHDAGFHEDEVALGFESKEAYSAYLAKEELTKLGIAEETIKKVEAAILSTHCDAECYSNEDKAVRAADLSGLAADYEVFKKNNLDLKKEFEILSGKTVDWDIWRKNATERVELFLRAEIKLTSHYYDENGNSKFHIKARENLKTLSQDESM